MVYSIMSLDVAHIDEICNDIKYQYEQGICDCVLFQVKLVPEGDPVINKAQIQMANYDIFRDKLASMGVQCGVLMQCTLGHGYPLNQHATFTKYCGLSTKENINTYCPYDQDFKDYMFSQAKIIAEHNPVAIMLDDDFRLDIRGGETVGCACALHLKAFTKLTGVEVNSNTQLKELLLTESENQQKYVDAFMQTQVESLLDMAKVIRSGIDSVNPKIQGSFCCCGLATGHGGEIAKIMAGKNNPVILRLNNGRYCAEGGKLFSNTAYRFAQQKEYAKGIVDYFLAETDTCPQNRYSTPANFLNSHYVLSILEGATGAKQWITRLPSYEPNSGKAFRKILAKHKGMYDALMKINTSIKWKGCRIPLFKKAYYGLEPEIKGLGGISPYFNCWPSLVLERLGLPLYFSSEQGGVAFFEDKTPFGFSDDEIIEMLKGTVVLSAVAAKNIQDRGLGEYLGVSIHEWQGPALSIERDTDNGANVIAQKKAWELRLTNKNTKALTQIFHLHNGTEEIPLFPGVTSFKNQLGGTTIVFAGTPDMSFNHTTFCYLNESRKNLFVKILKESGNLPLYYKDDGDLFIKVGQMPNDELICAVFDINFDEYEELNFVSEKEVVGVQRMNNNGELEPCDFEFDDKNGNCIIKSPVYPMQPAIFFIKNK